MSPSTVTFRCWQGNPPPSRQTSGSQIVCPGPDLEAVAMFPRTFDTPWAQIACLTRKSSVGKVKVWKEKKAIQQRLQNRRLHLCEIFASSKSLLPGRCQSLPQARWEEESTGGDRKQAK